MPKVILNNADAMAQQTTLNAIATLQSAEIDTVLVSGALAIHGSASPLAKIANTIYSFVNGILIKTAAADLPAFVGTVLTTTFNVFVFTIDSTGTTHTLMGTAAATIGAVVFPVIPANTAVIGFVVINPTGTGSFVGGTTALDDATVVPNAVYVNTPYSFNPNVLSLG